MNFDVKSVVCKYRHKKWSCLLNRIDGRKKNAIVSAVWISGTDTKIFSTGEVEADYSNGFCVIQPVGDETILKCVVNYHT